MDDGPATAVEDTAKVLRHHNRCPRRDLPIVISNLQFDVAIGIPLNPWFDGRGSKGSENTSGNHFLAKKLQSLPVGTVIGIHPLLRSMSPQFNQYFYSHPTCPVHQHFKHHP